MRNSEEYVQELRRDAEAGLLHPLEYAGFLDVPPVYPTTSTDGHLVGPGRGTQGRQGQKNPSRNQK